jgi:hypothetical protein
MNEKLPASNRLASLDFLRDSQWFYCPSNPSGFMSTLMPVTEGNGLRI